MTLADLPPQEVEFSTFFWTLPLGKGLKKNMENSILWGEGGSARVIFHFQIFLVPNGLKINFKDLLFWILNK